MQENETPSRRHRELGLSMIEAVAVVTVVSVLAMVAIPRLAALRREVTLRTVAGRLCGELMSCRAHAIFHHLNTALVFEHTADAVWRCFIAEDRDGDGVRRDDLEAGRDRVVGEVVELSSGGSGLGILDSQPVPDPGGDGWLTPDDPVRAGRGDIISFTPSGTATPSSIYLTDHHSRMRVLRVLGTTGRIRTLEWESGWPEWRQSWW